MPASIQELRQQCAAASGGAIACTQQKLMLAAPPPPPAAVAGRLARSGPGACCQPAIAGAVTDGGAAACRQRAALQGRGLLASGAGGRQEGAQAAASPWMLRSAALGRLQGRWPRSPQLQRPVDQLKQSGRPSWAPGECCSDQGLAWIADRAPGCWSWQRPNARAAWEQGLLWLPVCTPCIASRPCLEPQIAEARRWRRNHEARRPGWPALAPWRCPCSLHAH